MLHQREKILKKRDVVVKTKRNAFGLVIMIVISFVTQILSLLKSSVVAGIFGTSGAMDAYNLANNIATFVFGFVAAGISTVIIPEYANKRNEKAVDTFITVIYGLVAIVIAVMIAFRIHIVGMFSNRDEMFVNVAATAAIPNESGFLSFVFESATKTKPATTPTIILGTNEIIGFWNGMLPGIGS